MTMTLGRFLLERDAPRHADLVWLGGSGGYRCGWCWSKVACSATPFHKIHRYCPICGARLHREYP